MVKFVKLDPSTIKVNPELFIKLTPRKGLLSNVNAKNFFGLWRQEIYSSLIKSPFLIPMKMVIGLAFCKLIRCSVLLER